MADPNESSLDGVRGDGQDTRPDDARIARLDALGESLAKKRSDAISARESSGIEQQWIEDEEHYAGIDDANRNEHRNSWRTKPPGQAFVQVKGTTRSTVFPNITRPYVDAAAARIADMLLPTDDRSWSLKPTPIPDLVSIAEGTIPPDIQKQLAAPTAAGLPDKTAIAKATEALVAQAQQEQEDARKKAEKAEKRIEDWNVEGQWHAEVRRVIEDGARCGSGVLKGPFPIKRKIVALVDVGKDGAPAGAPSVLERLVGGIKKMFGHAQAIAKALIVKEEIKPTSKRVNFWDFYPDGSCGDNIHNGAYTWERDRLTERKLLDLKGGKGGYIDSQIDACIEEGAKKAIATQVAHPDQYLDDSEDKRFEIWYFHGFVGKEDLLAAGCDCAENKHPQIPAMIAMVNNRVIKAALNPLDSGDFPYDIMPWQRKDGMPWGDGVGRQGRTAQRIVTGATRHLMDNGGLSAGPQVVIQQGSITPADGKMEITPRKIWYWGEEATDKGDVKKAMHFFTIESAQKELMEIIQFGMKLMEDSTGLPMLLQGQQGKAPDTVGGMTLLNNNASAVLRRLARTFDDCITEPHIRRYYTWLLQYGEDDEKGDFQIDARGSSALVERDMQSQQMPQILQASGNPVFGIDPKKSMEEMLKSWHLDPKRFQFDDDKWQKIVESMAAKPGDPRVQVATIKEQAEDQRQQKELDAEKAMADAKNSVELMLGRINERIEAMKQGGAKEISFEEIKAMLAKEAMGLTTQKELAAVDHAVDIHKHHNPPPVVTPPTEPPGKAKVGEAFEA